MGARFDYFVMLAGMRTGSNLLEGYLNAADGLTCLGEAFNPTFIGYPNRTDLLGVSQEARDGSPQGLLEAVISVPEVTAGFRYFHDHDPRILETMLDDPRCAKIVLTRNPVQSHVSHKIAQATGQWKLTDVSRRKADRIHFDAAEFEAHALQQETFRKQVLKRLQSGGQTAFVLDYSDLQDLDLINGLVRWLGGQPLKELPRKLKPQNPESLLTKVENPKDMARAIADLDPFDLSGFPVFEPMRGAGVRNILAGTNLPLLVLPVPGVPMDRISKWLEGMDGQPPTDGFTQKTLRQWKRERPGHRSLSVIAHPLERAHEVYCRRILSRGPESFARIRQHLVSRYGMELPGESNGDGPDPATHKAGFLVYLDFLKANLAGQTPIRIDAEWGLQSLSVAAMARICPQDHLLREHELTSSLPKLAKQMGAVAQFPTESEPKDTQVLLDTIYDKDVESRAFYIYRRDYITFGFGPWKGMSG